MNATTISQRIQGELRNIGYRDDLLIPDYEYADSSSDIHPLRQIPLAGFAQTPPTYRNACIGVVATNGLSGTDLIKNHRSLGAPLIFETGSTFVNRWKMTRSGDPEFIERIESKQIENAFARNKEIWQPEKIFRAKSISLESSPYQLDFIDIGLMPALEGTIHKKLERLLKETFAEIIKLYQRYNQNAPPPEYIFRLVFRLIAAKVFRDRKFPGEWESDDAATVLKAVENHYNADSENVLPTTQYRREISALAWKVISSAFHFQNLSVDDLAFIYENTFITDKTRKKYGTHSTPPSVAEYIVRKLPFEELSQNDRHVLEPCSGHGIFLVSAMRRLRELLPSDISDKQRHRYFVNRLVGIEVDAFAQEVCRLSLMLADYPNPNGWRLYNEDVYSTNYLEQELKRADIVLCNPPFEDFTDEERAKYGEDIQRVQKPTELLRRILSKPPSLLGVVLPLAFNTGNSYQGFQRQLAESYGQIELAELPEVFNHSDVPTAILLASDRREQNKVVAISCRTYTKESFEEFSKEGKEVLATSELRTLPKKEETGFSLWIPKFSKLWNYLAGYQLLESEVEIHKGINWKGRVEAFKRGERRTDVISDIERHGFKRGVARAEGCLRQYQIQGIQWLSLRSEDQYDKAYLYPWSAPKVVCNAARLQRESWRIGAVADSIGLTFSKQFFALWPNGRITIYALAALLNSPLTNALCYVKDKQIDNRIQTLRALPIPSSDYFADGSDIDLLSRKLHKQVEEKQDALLFSDDAELKQLLLQLDAAVLKAYDLPPVLERELLDQFQGVPRPVPFEFTGYYPPDFSAYLPLHELISEEFEEARVDRFLEKFQPISDPVISEMFSLVTGA